MLASQEGLC